MFDFVEIRREPLDPAKLRGFILARSEQLTLMNLFNEDAMELNGYSVIRNSDIRRVRALAEESFMLRALRLKKIAPLPQDHLSISNWLHLLRSASFLFPLLTIRQEALDRNVCYVGQPVLASERSFTLKEIDPDARWRKRPRRYQFHHLTRVEFGGGYEDALWRVASLEHQEPSNQLPKQDK